jgi:hypothetical protein
MTNPLKIVLVSLVLSTVMIAEAANAVPINQCLRLIRSPQGGQEILVNRCSQCMTAQVTRTRPSGVQGTPTQRDYNMQGGSQMPLPFRGPGYTRITGEMPCPSARAPRQAPPQLPNSSPMLPIR